MINTTNILLIVGLVYIAFQIKKQSTRNLILIITGLLAFFMLDIKEGFNASSPDSSVGVVDKGTVDTVTGIFTAGVENSGDTWRIKGAETDVYFYIPSNKFTTLAGDVATATGTDLLPVDDPPTEITCKLTGGGGSPETGPGTVGQVAWATENFQDPTNDRLDNTNIIDILQCTAPGVGTIGGPCPGGVVPTSCNIATHYYKPVTETWSSSRDECCVERATCSTISPGGCPGRRNIKGGVGTMKCEKGMCDTSSAADTSACCPSSTVTPTPPPPEGKVKCIDAMRYDDANENMKCPVASVIKYGYCGSADGAGQCAAKPAAVEADVTKCDAVTDLNTATACEAVMTAAGIQACTYTCGAVMAGTPGTDWVESSTAGICKDEAGVAVAAAATLTACPATSGVWTAASDTDDSEIFSSSVGESGHSAAGDCCDFNVCTRDEDDKDELRGDGCYGNTGWGPWWEAWGEGTMGGWDAIYMILQGALPMLIIIAICYMVFSGGGRGVRGMTRRYQDWGPRRGGPAPLPAGSE